MDKDKLTIIVPVFNTAEFLEECIESILAQTFREFELILVDDGSTDGSGEICDEYQKRDRRIEVIHKENGGLISARKAGLKRASGGYVGFVDSDDWIEEDMYSVLYQEARKHKADIVMTDIAMCPGKRVVKARHGARPGFYGKKELIQELYPHMIYKDQIYTQGIYPAIWSKMMKREYLLQSVFQVDDRIKYGEDAASFYPCLLRAESLFYVQDYFPYHYRIHNKSMVHQRGLLDIEERMALFSHMNAVSEAFPYPGVERQIGLSDIARIEDLVCNFIQCGTRDDLKMLEKRIKEHDMWRKVLPLFETESLPKRTEYALRYIKDADESTLRKIKLYVLAQNCKQSCKQTVKNIIYRE